MSNRAQGTRTIQIKLSVLALYKGTASISSQNVVCSHHDIFETLLTHSVFALPHSLTL